MSCTAELKQPLRRRVVDFIRESLRDSKTDFTSGPIRVHGTDCLRILGLGFPIYAVGMIMIQALNGAGDARTPTRRISYASGWCRCRRPGGWRLARAWEMVDCRTFH